MSHEHDFAVTDVDPDTDASTTPMTDGGVAAGSEFEETDPSRSPTVTELAPGNGFLTDVWVNFKRWNTKAIRNPFVVVGSVVQPIVFLVLFSQVFGQVAGGAVGGAGGSSTAYLTFLVPAIVIQVSLIAAASSGIGLVNDMERGMFNKVLVSPMNRTAVFVGKTLSEILRITVQVVLILLLGYALGARVATGVPGALGIIGIAIVFSIWFTSFSNIVAVATGDTESTIIAANFLTLPLLFVSSAFLPVDRLPDWIQVISTVNPITYGVDAARELMMTGWTASVILPSIAVLIALDLVLGAIAVFYLNRASSSKVR